jgi:asparagine synthase (glutamine-hydrolysing)
MDFPTGKPNVIEYEGPSRLRQLMFHRINYSLAEDMLVKVDRMSMANSVEVRAPLLDADIADLSMRLPDQFLMGHGPGKRVWREAIRPWLPASLFTQPKRGFSIPIHRYQNSEYVGLCRQLLIDNKGTHFAEVFAREPVERCVERGLGDGNGSGQSESVYRRSHQLWALLQVAAWMQHFNVTA